MTDGTNYERLLNLKEAAERLHITEDTLRWLKHKDDGSSPPSFKVGRRIMFRQSDIEAWIKNRAGAA